MIKTINDFNWKKDKPTYVGHIALKRQAGKFNPEGAGAYLN